MLLNLMVNSFEIPFLFKSEKKKKPHSHIFCYLQQPLKPTIKINVEQDF